MQLGTLGILTEDIFNAKSEKFVDKNYLYLFIASNVSQEYKTQHLKIERVVFETRWHLIEKKDDFICVAIYLSESLIPDEIVLVGEDFKVSSPSDFKWKYHKVLLSINNKIEVVFLHEKSAKLFTWFR